MQNLPHDFKNTFLMLFNYIFSKVWKTDTNSMHIFQSKFAYLPQAWRTVTQHLANGTLLLRVLVMASHSLCRPPATALVQKTRTGGTHMLSLPGEQSGSHMPACVSRFPPVFPFLFFLGNGSRFFSPSNSRLPCESCCAEKGYCFPTLLILMCNQSTNSSDSRKSLGHLCGC